MATIILDEKTETGKILMATANVIKKTNKSIHVFSNDIMDDFLLGKIMEETATGNYVSEDEVMSLLHR
ncbi:hypothetical protein [Viscerimonas tarda]